MAMLNMLNMLGDARRHGHTTMIAGADRHNRMRRQGRDQRRSADRPAVPQQAGAAVVVSCEPNQRALVRPVVATARRYRRSSACVAPSPAVATQTFASARRLSRRDVSPGASVASLRRSRRYARGDGGADGRAAGADAPGLS